MRKRALIFCVAVGLLIPPCAPGARGTSGAAPVQCRTADRPIVKQLRFARGKQSARVADTIKLCTSHEYVLRARAGQTMSVRLVTGSRTSFTLYTPTGRIEEADGVREWSGELPETGRYAVSIGTDATANYVLEVSIR
jgi:hypothetical protein